MMKAADNKFASMQQKMIKHFVPMLKERDDYKTRIFFFKCDGCSEKTNSVLQYQQNGSDEWIDGFERSIVCLDCQGDAKAYELMELQQKEVGKEIGKRLKEDYLYIPDDLLEAGFKNFEHTNNVTKKSLHTAWDYCKDFVGKPDERYNLLIMGNPGTGKSHLCAAVTRYLQNNGYVVGFITTGTLLTKIKATYKNGAAKTEEQILKDLKKLDLLILDDLGSESNNKDEFAWSKKTLFEIVNSRIGKPTIYSTNFDDLKLPEAIGERVASRLYNNTKFIDMFIDKYDYRKKLQIK